MGGELEDSALSVGTGGDDTHVGGVVDGDDDAGGEDNLLPVVASWLVRQALPCFRQAAFSHQSSL